MSGYKLGLYEKSMPDDLSLGEKLAAAKAAGYDFLELSVDETDRKLARLDWTQAERDAVIVDMRKASFPIGSICLSGHRKYPLGHPDPAVRRRSLEIMAGAIRLAVDLGARIIQLAGYDVYYEPGNSRTRAFFAENLRKAVSMAAESGVILAFETMETEFLNTVEKAMYWVSVMDSPYLQVYPDAGNITNAAVAAGRDVSEDLKTGRGHLAALHLKETVPGVFREVPFGTGHVDFSAVAKTAFSLGVRRYVAEFWYDRDTDWKRVLSDNDRFLRRHLDTAEQIISGRPATSADPGSAG